MLRQAIIRTALLPLIRGEVPGWGALHKKFIVGVHCNEFWRSEPPRIIKDKRCGYFRVLNLSEWADRSLYFLGRWYDLEASLLVRALLKKGDRVLDVGANYGHFSLEAARAVGPSGSVMAFEPNPVSFARLSVHVALNKLSWVKLENVGLSDTEGNLTLHVPSINSGEATFGTSRYDDVTAVAVPVRRLDDLNLTEKIHFLKIDVEGFEVHVLRGARQLMERHRPFVLTEVVGRHLEGAGETRVALSDLLEGFGYKSFRLGLKGIGARQTLSLTAMPATARDGDFLWLPAENEQVIAPFVMH